MGPSENNCCAECGTGLERDDIFCGECGTRVIEETMDNHPEPSTGVSAAKINDLWETVDQYAEEGDLEQLHVVYLELVEVDSHNSASFMGLGLSYLQAGDVDSAVEEINKALEINPDDANGLITLGDTMDDLADVFAGLAEINFKQNKDKAGRNFLNHSLRLDRSNAAALRIRNAFPRKS